MLPKLIDSQLEVKAAHEDLAPWVLVGDLKTVLISVLAFSLCYNIRVWLGNSTRSTHPMRSATHSHHHSWHLTWIASHYSCSSWDTTKLALLLTWHHHHRLSSCSHHRATHRPSTHLPLVVVCRFYIDSFIQNEVTLSLILTYNLVFHLLSLVLILELHLYKAKTATSVRLLVSHDDLVSNSSKLRKVVE